jgi:uncharacterized protein YprB with RNaseH-like and TPR domain
MQVETPDFLRLVEQAGTLACVDIEGMGLHGDYNSVICVSIKPYHRPVYTFEIKQLGNDQKVVRDAREALGKLDCWVTYFGKGYDIKMLNTRLLRYGVPPIVKKPHLDLYWMLKSHTNTSRRSQGHLITWLELPEPKMAVSADVWATLGVGFKSKMEKMVKRCESDTIGLEKLYDRTKHIAIQITR